MSEERSKLRIVIFSLAWMLVVVICTAVVLKLIYNLWFPPFLNPPAVEVSPKVVYMEELASGIQPDNYTVAYRAAEAEFMTDRFHDWEIPNPVDRVSPCITCHGDFPHNNDEKTRAFLNKHDMHMACETCHITYAPMQEYFAWYEVETGALRNTLPIESPLLLSHYKLVLLPSANLSSYGSGTLQREANALLENASGMSAPERKQQLQKFHVNKRAQALPCGTCHTEEADTRSFIPYTRLGYSPMRARQINTTEVAGMIEKYEVFYLPTFILGQESR